MTADWKAAEAYYTPPSAILPLFSGDGPDFPRGLYCEPAVGDGAIVEAITALRPHRVTGWITNDLRPTHPPRWTVRPVFDHRAGDWFGKEADEYYLALSNPAEPVVAVVTNPPFRLAQEFVELSWRRFPKAIVIVLQRRTWRDEARKDFFRRHNPDEYTLARRVRFRWPNGEPVGKNGATYSCAHTWYVFGPDCAATGPRNGLCRTLKG